MILLFSMFMLLSTLTDPVMFFDCGIHAREWISTATCLYLIQVRMKC